MLKQIVDDRNHLFLWEIQLELLVKTGCIFTIATIWRTLRRHGYSRKKADVRALERDPVDRAAFLQLLQDFEPECFLAGQSTRAPLQSQRPGGGSITC